MWTALSAVYADFARVIDTCLKACSRYANGAQSASNYVIWITFSCVFNTSKLDVLETFDEIREKKGKTWSHKNDYISGHPYTEKRFLYNFIRPCKKRVLGDEKRLGIE